MAKDQRPEIQDRARPAKKVSARLAREHARKNYTVPERPFPGLEPIMPPEQESGISAAPHLEDVGVDERPGTGPGEGGPEQLEPYETDADDASPMAEYFRETDPRFSDAVEKGRQSTKVASQWPLTESAEVAEGSDFDPKDHTVEEVKKHVEKYPDQASRLQSLEESDVGKNRQGLVHWLEEHAL